MGHVAEQDQHGQQTPAEPPDDQAGRADLQQRPPAQPDEPTQVDPEQLRRFQQFQQFQEFQRFQELQRQAGDEPVPVQPPKRRRRAPRWLRWLGMKLLAWLIFFLLTAIALTWAANYFLGSDEGEQPPAAKTGGGTFHTNTILATKPYEAVRGVYDAIAKGAEPRYACGRMDRETQRAFAAHLGYANCRTAVRDLQTQVTEVNDYAESMPSSVSKPITGDTVRIKSCEFGISGGPALGGFTVSKVERGQWLITGHRSGPEHCTSPSTP